MRTRDFFLICLGIALFTMAALLLGLGIGWGMGTSVNAPHGGIGNAASATASP